MKIKSLKDVTAGLVSIPAGAVVDLPDERATLLVAQGHAEAVKSKPKPKSKSK